MFRCKERGAALVEAAIVVPFLVLLLLGVVDTAWLLAYQNEVRGAAREAGRVAATDDGDTAQIVARACANFGDDSSVTVSVTGAAGELGDPVDIQVTNQVDTLTGFLDWAFNPPVAISSTSTFRIETIPVSWSDTTEQGCP